MTAVRRFAEMREPAGISNVEGVTEFKNSFHGRQVVKMLNVRNYAEASGIAQRLRCGSAHASFCRWF
jgi:hypothetical protein